MSYATIGTTGTLIVDANSLRQSLIISNPTNQTLYIDQTSSVSSGSPFIAAGGNLTESNDGTKLYMGPYYGALSSATAFVTYWERTK